MIGFCKYDNGVALLATRTLCVPKIVLALMVVPILATALFRPLAQPCCPGRNPKLHGSGHLPRPGRLIHRQNHASPAAWSRPISLQVVDAPTNHP